MCLVCIQCGELNEDSAKLTCETCQEEEGWECSDCRERGGECLPCKLAREDWLISMGEDPQNLGEEDWKSVF